MPISWRVSGAQRVDVVFLDPYSLPESERVMKEVFSTAGLGRPLRFLVDVRRSTPPDIEFVTNAVSFWQQHVREMWDARIAVLVASERQLEMAHMSGRTAEARELPFRLRVFDSAAEAERWLSEP